MYNESQKQLFLTDYTDSQSRRNACISVFNLVEPFEDQLGADICTFDLESLKPAVSACMKVSRQITAKSRLNILRKYVAWCSKNGVKGVTDAIFQYNNDPPAEQMRRVTVVNPTELNRYLDSICRPSDVQSSDESLRCAVWLAFGGMMLPEIVKVSTDDVDLSRLSVTFNGVTYEVCREGMQSLRNCATLGAFKNPSGAYKTETDSWLMRAPGTQLVRGTRGEYTAKTLGGRLRTNRCKASDPPDKDLSFRRIWLSGAFYRAYELEMAGVKPDFRMEAMFLYEHDTERPKPDDISSWAGREYVTRTARSMVLDYVRWKKTFM